MPTIPPFGQHPSPGGDAELIGAACAGTNPDQWFSLHPVDIADCLLVCGSCPIRVACLAVAVQHRERHGIWGGRLFLDASTRTRLSRDGRRRKATQPTSELRGAA